MRIMVVDDSSTMRALVTRSLKADGFADVVECDSGTKALEILNDSRFDLVLLDWHMPDVDGLEVLKRIRGGPHGQTAVIMLTMEQKRKNIELAIKNGANDYVIKPLNQRILRDKIDRIRRAAIAQQHLKDRNEAGSRPPGTSSFSQSNPFNSADSSTANQAEELN